MIHYVKGDITTSDCDFICHQVNCQGKMNSGVAKAIREKWPQVYQDYRDKYEGCIWSNYSTSHMLGDIQICALYDNHFDVDKHQNVVNLFAQDAYGYDGKRYTSYDAFWQCLNNLKQCVPEDATMAFPYKIGCVRGGADWDVIETMIIKTLQGREVYFYYLDENILESQDKFICLFCNNNYIMTMEGKNEQENN